MHKEYLVCMARPFMVFVGIAPIVVSLEFQLQRIIVHPHKIEQDAC